MTGIIQFNSVFLGQQFLSIIIKKRLTVVKPDQAFLPRIISELDYGSIELKYLKSFIMTNLTRLRLILVDLLGLMKKPFNPFPSAFFP